MVVQRKLQVQPLRLAGRRQRGPAVVHLGGAAPPLGGLVVDDPPVAGLLVPVDPVDRAADRHWFLAGDLKDALTGQAELGRDDRPAAGPQPRLEPGDPRQPLAKRGKLQANRRHRVAAVALPRRGPQRLIKPRPDRLRLNGVADRRVAQGFEGLVGEGPELPGVKLHGIVGEGFKPKQTLKRVTVGTLQIPPEVRHRHRLRRRTPISEGGHADPGRCRAGGRADRERPRALAGRPANPLEPAENRLVVAGE